MQNEVGLAMGHAYTVQGVVEVTDAQGKKTKLVRMRNPWGTEKYKGPWCDSCDEWTDETAKQAGHANSNDGVSSSPSMSTKSKFPTVSETTTMKI